MSRSIPTYRLRKTLAFRSSQPFLTYHHPTPIIEERRKRAGSDTLICQSRSINCSLLPTTQIAGRARLSSSTTRCFELGGVQFGGGSIQGAPSITVDLKFHPGWIAAGPKANSSRCAVGESRTSEWTNLASVDEGIPSI